jgi:hypothetical protein
VDSLKKISKSVSKSAAKSATKAINSMKFDLMLSTSVEKIYNHIKNIIKLSKIISNNNVEVNIKNNINLILNNEEQNYNYIQSLDTIIKADGFTDIKLDRNINTDTNSLPSSINYTGKFGDDYIQEMKDAINNNNTKNSIGNINCIKIIKLRRNTKVQIIKNL